MIDKRHWMLWARDASEGVGHLGHRNQSVLHTTPRRGSSRGSFLDFVNDDDRVLADAIGRGVVELGHVDRKAREVLREWWGAYPEHDPRRTFRVAKLGLNHRVVRSLAERYQAWVEGWIYAQRGVDKAGPPQ